MGGWVAGGAGGELRLRLRVLGAAAGIVAVSLLLSGALTWVLVRNLELQSAQDQLDRSIIGERALVIHDQCLVRTGPASNAGPATCRLDDGRDYKARLSLAASQLGADRLLLLTGQFQVAFLRPNPTPHGQLHFATWTRVNRAARHRINFHG